MAGSYGHNLMSHLSKHNMSVRQESWQNNYSSSIRSILNMTGLVPSEQQHIISFSRFIHPFMIEPPCSPVYIYREMAICLRAMWHFRTSSYCVRVSGCFDERIQASMPEMVVLFVTLKDKLIANIVAWTHSCFRVSAILLL